MHAVLLAVALSAIFATFVRCFDVELNADGDWNSAVAPDNEARSIIVRNTYPDKDVELFWQSPDSNDDVYMFAIYAQESANLNTFNGHNFFVREIGQEERLADTIDVTGKTKFYTIGPNADKGSGYKSKVSDGITPLADKRKTVKKSVLDSPLKIIGSRTTAMAAKFRCHCTAVDYYYDDGVDGIFQGSLTLGKETTINTYEGHVFYFTKKDDKSVEIDRYQMREDKVIFGVQTSYLARFLFNTVKYFILR